MSEEERLARINCIMALLCQGSDSGSWCDIHNDICSYLPYGGLFLRRMIIHQFVYRDKWWVLKNVLKTLDEEAC
jgi:hypothetical protein